MPFFSVEAKSFSNAILHGDVATVRRMLNQRNPQGQLPFNLNSLPHANCPGRNSVDQSAFEQAAYYEIGGCMPSQTRYDIIEAILFARGSDNNPLIKLNRQDIFQPANFLETLFENASYLQPNHLRQLTDRIINLRDTQGRRVCHISRGGQRGVLNAAILHGDPEIVRTLVDLRNRDGFFAIDVNAVYREKYDLANRPYTALDLLMEGRNYYLTPDPAPLGYQPNPEILRILNAAGACRYGEIRPNPQRIVTEEREIREPLENENQGPNGHSAAQAQIDEFNGNAQNIHTPEVERTIDNAINELIKVYGRNPDTTRVIQEIKEHIQVTKAFKPDELVHVRRGFEYILQNKNAVHAKTGLTLLQILGIVWLGATNPNAIPADQPQKIDRQNFCLQRKDAVLQHFKDIATTYSDRPDGHTFSCIGGTRNQIVQSLHKAHPGVDIAATPDALVEVILRDISSFTLDKLRALPRKQQIKILQTWPQMKEEKTTFTDARDFYSGLQNELVTRLNTRYGGILNQQKLDEFTCDEHYYSSEKPQVHDELDGLLVRIESLYAWDENSPLYLAQKRIKNEAENLFNVDRGSFDEDYNYLHQQFVIYEEIASILNNIPSGCNKITAQLEQTQGLVELKDKLIPFKSPLCYLQKIGAASAELKIQKNTLYLKAKAFKQDGVKTLEQQQSQSLQAVLSTLDTILEKNVTGLESIKNDEELFRLLHSIYLALKIFEKSEAYFHLQSNATLLKKYHELIQQINYHENLVELLDKIHLLSADADSPLSVAQQRIKSCAENLFSIDRGDFNQDYIYLHQQFNIYQNIENSLKDLPSGCDNITKQLSAETQDLTGLKNSLTPFQCQLAYLQTIGIAYKKLNAEEKRLENINKKDSSKLCERVAEQLRTSITGLNSLNNLQSIQGQLSRVLRDFKRSKAYFILTEDYAWKKAYIKFKNALLCIPIFGWSVGMYRVYSGKTFFCKMHTTEAQQKFDTLKTAISKRCLV